MRAWYGSLTESMATNAFMRAKHKEQGARIARHRPARLQIRCTSCGFTKPWTQAARLKAGARAYLITACAGCKRLHMHAIEEVPTGPFRNGA